MRVLVTGTHGQLAQSLAERARVAGDVAVDLLGRPTLDLLHAADSVADLRRRRPDLIVNAAAYTAVDQAEDDAAAAFAINAEAPGILAQAAAAIGAGFVQLSTDYVYDGAADRPYREDDPVGPLGVYGRSKLAGEKNARSANPATIVVRTAWVYSPFGRNFVKTMVELARTRDRLTVVGDQIGNPSSALDLADGILALARRRDADPDAGSGETYHLAGTGEASWAELAGHVMGECAASGQPAARIEPIPTSQWPTKATRPGNSRLDTGKFARTFGYVAPHWRTSASAVVRRLVA